ncbi:hypothetical protein [Janibacter melonis]|uniref:hypothetical protein n=1 Tax=Janibacter melonis TaxID=262209 RepID=UPI0020946DC6|nr:hypothetical protein [Janibacter melonis]
MSADGAGLPADVALREAAGRALPLLGIEAERLGPVAPGATTFAVDLVGGGRLAPRLRPVVDADEGRVHGRAAWAQALAMAGVDVATPRTGPAGEEQVLLPGLAPDEQLRASATWWCEGEGVTDLDADRSRALGATAARMHEQASGWAAPEGAFAELLDPLAG